MATSFLLNIKKIFKNIDKILFSYSKYSYILIGALLIITYLPKIISLFLTVIIGGIQKLLGKSQRISPDTLSKIAAEVNRLSRELNIEKPIGFEKTSPDSLSKIAAEVERLAKQLKKDTPKNIVKDVENAIKVTKKLSENIPANITNTVAELVDDLEIDLDESENIVIPRKPGRPSSKWKKVKEMVKDKKFKKLVKNNTESVPEQSEKKGFWESLFDETQWADEDLKSIEQTGGAISYRKTSDFVLLFILLSGIYYFDYTKKCGKLLDDKLFKNGITIVSITLFIYFIITKIGFIARIHYKFNSMKLGFLTELFDGLILFILYNIINNIINLTSSNVCPINVESFENVVEDYIVSIKGDIDSLIYLIEKEKSDRISYQEELEKILSEKDAITEEYRSKISEQISQINVQYSSVSASVEELEAELNQKVLLLESQLEALETKISDLIINQSKMQSLLSSRIDDLDTAQDTFQEYVMGRLEETDSSIFDLQEQIDSYNEKLQNYVSKSELQTQADRITLLEGELSDINIQINNNAANILENTDLLLTLEKRVSALENQDRITMAEILLLKTELSNTIDDLSTTSSSNADDIKINQTLISVLQLTLSDIENTIATMKSSQTSVEDTTTDNSTQITNLKNTITLLSASVESNKLLIEALNIELTDLISRVSVIEEKIQDIDSIQSKLTVLESAINVNTDAISSLQTTNTSFEKRITDNREDIDDLEDDSVKFTKYITGLREDIEDLEDLDEEISVLEDKIKVLQSKHNDSDSDDDFVIYSKPS